MGYKILIIDDSDSIREVVGFTLENAGHDVHKAVDGINALTFFNGQKFDLVITDLHMPNMNGLELIRKVRAMDDYKFVPILFLTTESQTAKKMEAKEAGATGWIVKPFAPEKLLEAINKVVR
jgi:two-component system chemotaxis response regulator CheY